MFPLQLSPLQQVPEACALAPHGERFGVEGTDESEDDVLEMEQVLAHTDNPHDIAAIYAAMQQRTPDYQVSLSLTVVL